MNAVTQLRQEKQAGEPPRLHGNRWARGARWFKDPYQLLDHALETVGLTFRTRLPVLGDVLVTGDPELLRQLIAGRDFDAGTPISALRALLGSRSLIMLHGESHAARRRRIAALFRGDVARRYEPWMIERVAAELDRNNLREPFSAYDLVQRIALRAILAALFGVEVAEGDEAVRLVQRFLNSFRSPLILFIKALRVDAGPLSPWGRAMRNRRQLCAFIRTQIEDHRRTNRATLLGQLLASQSQANAQVKAPADTDADGRDTDDRNIVDGALDDEDIVEEILSLLLFGHDTGAATMAWAFAHIYSNPEVVRSLEQEATEWRRRGCLDPDELPLLRASLNESMRMAPVVVHLSRRVVRDTQLGGIPLRTGETVIPCTYLAQHNPAVFPNPYAFQPERFLHGERYEGSFFPFGFGNRTCVGKPFVLRQMPLMLGAILASARLKLADGYTPRAIRRMVLMAPAEGALMEFRTTPSPASSVRGETRDA